MILNTKRTSKTRKKETMQYRQEFNKIMDEYAEDIKRFGFRLESHDIDFNGLDNKRVKYICEKMREYFEVEQNEKR